MEVSNGYLTLGRIAGVPVRAHWSVPIGAVVFSRFSWAPGFWVGFVLLVLIHELGHAAVVKACRASVIEVNLHALGGECRYVGGVSALQNALISWGGVLGQLVVLIVALVLRYAVTSPPLFVRELLSVWIDSNLMLMAINLVPIAPLDGATAWKLPGLLREWWRRRRQRSRLRVVGGSDVQRGADEPMPEALKREIERITREAVRDARNLKN